MIEQSYFSKDILDFLSLLSKYKVQYLIIGSEAVIYYGHARLTGDIDIYYDIEEKNIDVLFSALLEFWDNDIPGIENKNALMQKGNIFQFGIPPNRIDLLNEVDGIIFNEAWKNRNINYLESPSGKIEIYYIGLNDLIKNKQAIGRYRDKEDLKFLIKAARKDL